MVNIDSMALALSKPPKPNQRPEDAGLGLEWIDMSPVLWRSDAHQSAEDCLHFMMPGPMNLFSILLLQKLYNKEI